jgi:hypothetical protein
MNRWNDDTDTNARAQKYRETARPANNQMSGRQRDLNELYDMYDFFILNALLKRHPHPGETKE